MNQSSDTPPDGDFARYIDQLMSANAAHAAARTREDLLQFQTKELASPSKSRAATAQHPLAPASVPVGSPIRPVSPASLIAKGFASHLKWMVLGLIGLQLLGMVWAGATMLFIPLLLVYVGWLIFGLNRSSLGELMARFQAWVQKVAEQTRKP